MGALEELAELIKDRNRIDDKIAALINRPAHPGHLSEFVAADIFDIRLDPRANNKDIDGYFNSGLLARRSVNVKWRSRHNRLINLKPDSLCDYYLVLAGPKAPARSSLGSSDPWVISYVFLFHAGDLIAHLRARSRMPGQGMSLPDELWEHAQIHPRQNNLDLPLTDLQRQQIALFAPTSAEEKRL